MMAVFTYSRSGRSPQRFFAIEPEKVVLVDLTGHMRQKPIYRFLVRLRLRPLPLPSGRTRMQSRRASMIPGNAVMRAGIMPQRIYATITAITLVKRQAIAPKRQPVMRHAEVGAKERHLDHFPVANLLRFFDRAFPGTRRKPRFIRRLAGLPEILRLGTNPPQPVGSHWAIYIAKKRHDRILRVVSCKLSMKDGAALRDHAMPHHKLTIPCPTLIPSGGCG